GFLFVELQLPDERAPRRQQADQRRERRAQNQRDEKFCAAAFGGKHFRAARQVEIHVETNRVLRKKAARLLLGRAQQIFFIGRGRGPQRRNGNAFNRELRGGVGRDEVFVFFRRADEDRHEHVRRHEPDLVTLPRQRDSV